jgi:hypothetical protein
MESNDNSRSFCDLPPEILTKIFAFIPIKDSVNLAQTCKKLNSIFDIEYFWEIRIKLDFGIDIRRTMKKSDLQKNDNAVNMPSNLYKFILHKYGKSLGLWQRQSLGYYGALVQVKRDCFFFNDIKMTLIIRT